ncbi:MAG: outer membrane lipoprotein-sorting protein [Nitrospirae bacterium]|nr:outer membrane lipoprotein-sorting protein [Nitrospirota bacterium]
MIRSTPKAGDMNYEYKLSWIDKGNFLPMKEEYYNKKGELDRVYTSDEIKEVKGFSTVTKRTMKNHQSGHTTEVNYLSVDYNIDIEDSLFTERYLRQPLKKWIE